MKKPFVFLLALVVTAATLTEMAISKPSYKLASPEFDWNETTHDFGNVKIGEPVSHEFSFSNSGNAPLIISSVKASCGCTVAEYTKEPINSGGQGYVLAKYDAAKVGTFSKTISVSANTSEIIVLTIRGEVVK